MPVLVLFITGVTVYWYIQSPEPVSGDQRKAVEQVKIERANLLTKTSENQIAERLVTPLENLLPLLTNDEVELKSTLQGWLKNHPDVLAITLWKQNQEWPIRILKENFWDLAPVKQITPEKRQALFSFIFQNTFDHINPLHFGDILPSSYFGFPAISVTELLDNQSYTGIRVHVLVKNIQETVTLSLDSLESFSILDQEGHALIVIGNPSELSALKDKDDPVQWLPQSLSIQRSFQNLPWKTLYSATIPAIKTTNLPARRIPYSYIVILLVLCFILSWITI